MLPHSEDKIGDNYHCIRDAITGELKRSELIPTASGSFAPAAKLIQGSPEIKQLLPKADLGLMPATRQFTDWIYGPIPKDSRQYKLLFSTVHIKQWSAKEFYEYLEVATAFDYERGKKPQPEVIAWLSQKDDVWHQKLYALFGRQLHDISNRPYARTMRIIRGQDNEYCSGADKCYFAPSGNNIGININLVKREVFASGSNVDEQCYAKSFLKRIGVDELGEEQYIESILNQRYSSAAPNVNDSVYFDDLVRFMEFRRRTPLQANIFNGYRIFKNVRDEFVLASQVFLDEPFCESGLAHWYHRLRTISQLPGVALSRLPTVKSPLSKTYVASARSFELDDFRRFAEFLGVERSVRPRSQSAADSHRKFRNLSRSRENENTKDEDWYIAGLSLILKEPTIEVAQILWSMMQKAEPKWLQAVYKKNRSHDPILEMSTLVYDLSELEWLPTRSGRFCRPEEVTDSNLASGFSISPKDRDWLRQIGFGRKASEATAESKANDEFAKRLGFETPESLARAQRFAKLSATEQDQLLAEIERRRIDLPEDEPSNPDHRRTRVQEQAHDAPERSTEIRSRSVSVNRDAVKAEADPYLIAQYTNVSDQMICQVCQSELPFKLSDESYFFETVQFLAELPGHHKQNYLALCPNHSAMFRHANGTREEMKAMFEELTDDRFEVVLGQRNHTIYFTKTHRQDLLAVIEAMNE